MMYGYLCWNLKILLIVIIYIQFHIYYIQVCMKLLCSLLLFHFCWDFVSIESVFSFHIHFFSSFNLYIYFVFFSFLFAMFLFCSLFPLTMRCKFISLFHSFLLDIVTVCMLAHENCERKKKSCSSIHKQFSTIVCVSNITRICSFIIL